MRHPRENTKLWLPLISRSTRSILCVVSMNSSSAIKLSTYQTLSWLSACTQLTQIWLGLNSFCQIKTRSSFEMEELLSMGIWSSAWEWTKISKLSKDLKMRGKMQITQFLQQKTILLGEPLCISTPDGTTTSTVEKPCTAFLPTLSEGRWRPTTFSFHWQLGKGKRNTGTNTLMPNSQSTTPMRNLCNFNQMLINLSKTN